jgi:hypothetical protein
VISLKSRIASVTISAVMFTHCGAPNQGADTPQMSSEAAFGNQPPTVETPDGSNRETSADAGTNNGGKITQIFQLVGALNDAGIDPIKAWQATNKLTSLLRIAQDGNLSLAARIAQIQRETTKMLADPAIKRDLAEQAKVIAHLDPVKVQNIFSRAIINFGGVNDLTTQILNTAQSGSQHLLQILFEQKGTSKKLQEQLRVIINNFKFPESKATIAAGTLEMQDLLKQLLATNKLSSP